MQISVSRYILCHPCSLCQIEHLMVCSMIISHMAGSRYAARRNLSLTLKFSAAETGSRQLAAYCIQSRLHRITPSNDVLCRQWPSPVFVRRHDIPLALITEYSSANYMALFTIQWWFYGDSICSLPSRPFQNLGAGSVRTLASVQLTDASSCHERAFVIGRNTIATSGDDGVHV